MKSEKKLLVLQQLNKEPNPISLLELREKLGENFKERSLRRWLKELLEEDLIIKSGQKRATKYQIKQPPKNVASNCFNPESMKIVEKIKRPLYERTPIT